jgi:hypothetical protein
LGLKFHKFKLIKFAAFKSFVTNFLHFSISFSSKVISFHKLQEHAQYLTGSAQYFCINSSGVVQALFFDLLIFSHFGAKTCHEIIIFLKGIFQV